MQLSTALKAFQLLQESGPLDLTDFTQRLGYSNKTMTNLVSDLQTFYLVTKGGNNIIAAHEDIEKATLPEIADHLVRQLSDHVLIKEATNQLGSGTPISVEDLRELFGKIDPVSNFRSRTWATYTNRLIPWLRFSGLIETAGQNVVIRPKGEGKQKGVFEGHTSPRQKGSVFLCNSGPRQAIDLAADLVNQQTIASNVIEQSRYRNAAFDLINLGLAIRLSKRLAPSLSLNQLKKSDNLQKDVSDLIRVNALSSPFLSALKKIIIANPEDEIDSLHRKVSGVIGRTWSQPSAKRYIKAGLLWLRYFEQIDGLPLVSKTHAAGGKYNLRQAAFLCGSTPERAIKLCVSLVIERVIAGNRLTSEGLARSATDVVALGLAVRSREGLVPSSDLLELSADKELAEAVKQCVKTKALSSTYLTQLNEILQNNPAATLSELVPIVLSKVSRKWSPATASRNISVGKTWLSFFTQKELQTSLFNEA